MGLTVYGGGGKPEEEKTVTAGTSVIEVLPSSGKTMKKVTVNPTPSQSKTVTPSTSQQTVSPDSGKLLSQVIVKAMEDVTPEVTAQTPVITQIAENLGVTITTPSGTNKQILQGNNSNLQSIKTNAKKSGQYAWKKYTKATKSVTLKFTHTPPKTWTVSSNDIDVHSIDASFFVGFSGWYVAPQYTYEFVNTNQAVFDGTSYVSYNYNPDTAQIVFGSNVASGNINVSDSTQIKIDMTFIDYVFSDDENTYPDGGEQNGYWYRKADSGLNVWAKYEYTPPVTVTNPSFYGKSGNTNIFISNANFDLNAVQNAGKFFAGFSDPLDSQNYFLNADGNIARLHTYFQGSNIINATYNPTNSRFDCDIVPYAKNIDFVYNGVKNLADEIKTLVGFVVDDNTNKYPNGAVHTDGYYYELLGQVTSANVMSLSDNAVMAVQQDYRDTIETEVSNANS